MTTQEINDTVLLSKQCLEATARVKYLVYKKKLTIEDAVRKVFPILKGDTKEIKIPKKTQQK